MLTDTLSNSPVIVCDYRKIKPILNNEMIKIFQKQNFELGFYEDIITSGISERFRVIPFSSLGDDGIMAAIQIDGAVLKSAGQEIEIENLIQNCVWICKKYLDGQTNTEVAQQSQRIYTI